jgi:EpsI family protein
MRDNAPTNLHSVISRRSLLVGGAMLAAAGAAAAREPRPNRPRIRKKEFEALVPKVVGEWRFETASGLVLPPSDALSDRLYDSLVTRIYSNPDGDRVMMLLAYNNRQDGMLQIHRPEICYPAGGYVLTPTTPVNVAVDQGVVVPSNIFSAISGERNEQVLYWTRVGDDFPQSWRQQRLVVLRSNIAQIIPDGMLARVSMAGEDMATSMPVMQNFVAALYDASSPRLRSLLFATQT